LHILKNRNQITGFSKDVNSFSFDDGSLLNKFYVSVPFVAAPSAVFLSILPIFFAMQMMTLFFVTALLMVGYISC